MLCLLEHKLQDPNEQPASADAKVRRGHCGRVQLHGRMDLRATQRLQRACGAAAGAQPRHHRARARFRCLHERVHWEATLMHVVLAYAPNSGREGRLEFRLQQWEPSVRALLSRLQRSGKPVLFQGDLNVAHRRELDAWGTTDAEFGHFKAS